MSFYCLLICIVSDKNLAIIHIFDTLYVVYFFSAAFKISFLSLVFTNLNMLCIGVLGEFGWEEYLFCLQFLESFGYMVDVSFLENSQS